MGKKYVHWRLSSAFIVNFEYVSIIDFEQVNVCRHNLGCPHAPLVYRGLRFWKIIENGGEGVIHIGGCLKKGGSTAFY